MLLLRVLPRRLLPLVTLVEALLIVRRVMAGRRTAPPAAGGRAAPRNVTPVTRNVTPVNGQRYGG